MAASKYKSDISEKYLSQILDIYEKAFLNEFMPNIMAKHENEVLIRDLIQALMNDKQFSQNFFEKINKDVRRNINRIVS